MAKTKRFFISDIHLTSQDRYDDMEYRSWYKPPEHDPRLLGFLDNYVLGNVDNVKDVILLGDIFNTWMCPANVVPPTYEQIFKSNRNVLDKFQDIINRGINLFFIPGNHDFDVKPAEIMGAINGIRVIRYYLSGRIHAEHGHDYDLFNRARGWSTLIFGWPIGYFMSRLIASAGGDEFATLDLVKYIDDILEAPFTSQSIYGSIIEGLAERAGLEDNDEIRMSEANSLRIGDIKERCNRLGDIYSIRELVNNLYERRYLDATADRLCRELSADVVVFGHTHKAKIDKDWFLVENRIYANSGSWCKNHAYCVEIDKDRHPAHPLHVYLHKVDDKGNILKADTKEERL